jgi:hypothetical protein
MTKLNFKISLLAGICLISNSVFSQTSNDTIPKRGIDTVIVEKPNRLKFGCGFGLNFVGGTSVSISPNLMYKITNKFAVGGGIQGSYNAIKKLQSTITYGANVLGQYSPTNKITTLLEFNQLRVSTKTDSNNVTKNYWDAALFVGAGYNITSKISIGAKYNLLYKEGESIYTSPVIPFVNISF